MSGPFLFDTLVLGCLGANEDAILGRLTDSLPRAVRVRDVGETLKGYICSVGETFCASISYWESWSTRGQPDSTWENRSGPGRIEVTASTAPVAAQVVPFRVLELESATKSFANDTGPLAAEFVCGELCSASKPERDDHPTGDCERRSWV